MKGDAEKVIIRREEEGSNGDLMQRVRMSDTWVCTSGGGGLLVEEPQNHHFVLHTFHFFFPRIYSLLTSIFLFS